jgi:hypothetical protein
MSVGCFSPLLIPIGRDYVLSLPMAVLSSALVVRPTHWLPQYQVHKLVKTLRWLPGFVIDDNIPCNKNQYKFFAEEIFMIFLTLKVNLMSNPETNSLYNLLEHTSLQVIV